MPIQPSTHSYSSPSIPATDQSGTPAQTNPSPHVSGTIQDQNKLAESVVAAHGDSSSNSSSDEVGLGESLIPVWGSGKQAYLDFQKGHWGWGLFNSALAVSDVFLVKAAVTDVGKIGWKVGKALLEEGVERGGKSGARELTAKAVQLDAEAAKPGAVTSIKGKYPEFNPHGSNTNCGACSDAVEHYKATGKAKPAPNGPRAWPKSAKQWQFPTSPTQIESTLIAGGNGSRGIVYVADAAGNAHVFNVENQAGKIVAIDGQTGVEGSIKEVADHAGYSGSKLQWGWGPTHSPAKP